MKAYITSIGETTTDLCAWSLKRNGFDVEILKDNSSLAHKLKTIYYKADEDFVRVDADVIVNNKFKPGRLYRFEPEVWWVQFMTFDMFQLDKCYGGVQFIKKQALKVLRDNIDLHLESERPESQMYRLDQFMNPRRCISDHTIYGIHGYKQGDIDRVKDTKKRRHQSNYDFEMARKLEEL